MPLFNWSKTNRDGLTPARLTIYADETHAEYKKLSQDEDMLERANLRQSNWSNFLFIGNLLLFIMSTCALSLSIYTLKFGANQDYEKELSRHTSFFSLDTMMPQWGPRLSAQHTLASNESIWLQSPSDAVDMAWGHVTDVGMLEITRDELLKLGKTTASAVRTPPTWLGDDENSQDDGERYIAIIDGLHLLHCLNSMRKSLYHNYHHYFPDGYPSSFGAYLSHCHETLAHWLMCQPSMEFVSFGWYERREPPFPDFDITRKCVDFEQILDWQEQHRLKNLTKPMFDSLRPPEGMQRRKAPVMYDEILDNTWDDILEPGACRVWS